MSEFGINTGGRPALAVDLEGAARAALARAHREAEALATQVRDALPSTDVRTVQVSPVIGVHTGPAALGAAIDLATP